MDQDLGAALERNRPRFQAMAFPMLGSLEAEDAVQETWIRLGRSDAEGIDSLGGWLTTVLFRVCLGMLRPRRTRREEPIETRDLPPELPTLEKEAVLADTMGAALLVVLDTPTPAERLAFVLHDVFAVPFDEVALIVGRSPAVTRQLASRARRRLQGTDEMPSGDRRRQQEDDRGSVAATAS